MEHLVNTSYFLTALMVTAANPFLTIILIGASYYNGNMYEIVKMVHNGIYSSLIITACLSPILIILYAVSRLSKWHGI